MDQEMPKSRLSIAETKSPVVCRLDQACLDHGPGRSLAACA